MDSALAAIAVSVLMHVGWNLLARLADPRSNFLWWGVSVHLVLLGPWSLFRLWQDAHWQPVLVAAIVVTGLANSAYFLGLRGAYRHAPVGLVYPLARSSPLLIALWSVLFFGEELAALGWAGIVLSVAGLLWLGLSARGGDARHALPWAALAALCTSIYSLSDKIAVAHLPSFGSQLGLVSAGYLMSWCVLSAINLRDNGRLIPALRPAWSILITGGLCIGTAYALVIHAMQYLPAAYVVAFTNAGLVLATLIGIVALGERSHWRGRLAAVCVVSAGIALVALAR